MGAIAYPSGTLAGAGAWFVWLGSAAGLGRAGTPANAYAAGYGDQAAVAAPIIHLFDRKTPQPSDAPEACLQ